MFNINPDAFKENPAETTLIYKPKEKKNESSLSEIYNSMLIPDANMYVIAKQGLRTVSSMGGNKLTSETRVKYTNYFNKILSDVAAGKDAKGSAIDNK